jgi:putative ABC transport system ATP-binding protein
VTKVWEGGVTALAGVDLTVRRGEFVAVTGPSGSGKSTLLGLLAALDVPTSGTLRVDGWDLVHLRDADRYRRLEVGLVFQLHNLLPRLSAADNVEIAMVGTDLPRRERAVRARSLLGEVGLADKADRFPPQLSGGERQRVAIARALANEPQVLLADEPTGSLDPDSVDRVMTVVDGHRTARSMTVVVVTHAEEVAARADRTVRMRDGRNVAD